MPGAQDSRATRPSPKPEVRPHALGLGVCLGRDAVAWRESPPAAQRTHYSDGTKT